MYSRPIALKIHCSLTVYSVEFKHQTFRPNQCARTICLNSLLYAVHVPIADGKTIEMYREHITILSPNISSGNKRNAVIFIHFGIYAKEWSGWDSKMLSKETLELGVRGSVCWLCHLLNFYGHLWRMAAFVSSSFCPACRTHAYKCK